MDGSPRDSLLHLLSRLFVLYSFNYTGKLNDFDWTIYWGQIAGGAATRAFSALRAGLSERAGRPPPLDVSLIYLPGPA